MYNPLTYGYSLAFFAWPAWEKQIDFAAMMGVNTLLAFAGQEYVFSRLFGEYNITLEEQQSFFAGPAFLPWNRMGYLQVFVADCWLLLDVGCCSCCSRRNVQVRCPMVNRWVSKQ